MRNRSLQQIIRQNRVINRINMMISLLTLGWIIIGGMIGRPVDMLIPIANVFYQLFMAHWQIDRVKKWNRYHQDSYNDQSNGE